MKTLIDVFAENKMWRRQLEDVERLRSSIPKVEALAWSIDDKITGDYLLVVTNKAYGRLATAEKRLKEIEEHILRQYSLSVYDRCDYSATYDDEYFIERIDLDGYLRGFVL